MLILGENKFQNIDPTLESGKKTYLGRKYKRASDGMIVHEKRCNICGKIFDYEITVEKLKKYILEGRWDVKNSEVTHCGNSTCRDWEERRFKHIKRVNEQKADEVLSNPHMQKLFQENLKKGFVA